MESKQRSGRTHLKDRLSSVVSILKFSAGGSRRSQQRAAEASQPSTASQQEDAAAEAKPPSPRGGTPSGASETSELEKDPENLTSELEHEGPRSMSRGSAGSISSVSSQPSEMSPKVLDPSANNGLLDFAAELPEGHRVEMLIDPIPSSDSRRLLQGGAGAALARDKSTPGMQVLYASDEALLCCLVGKCGPSFWSAFVYTFHSFMCTSRLLTLLESIVSDGLSLMECIHARIPRDDGIIALVSNDPAEVVGLSRNGVSDLAGEQQVVPEGLDVASPRSCSDSGVASEVDVSFSEIQGALGGRAEGDGDLDVAPGDEQGDSSDSEESSSTITRGGENEGGAEGAACHTLRRAVNALGLQLSLREVRSNTAKFLGFLLANDSGMSNFMEQDVLAAERILAECKADEGEEDCAPVVSRTTHARSVGDIEGGVVEGKATLNGRKYVSDHELHSQPSDSRTQVDGSALPSPQGRGAERQPRHEHFEVSAVGGSARNRGLGSLDSKAGTTSRERTRSSSLSGTSQGKLSKRGRPSARGSVDGTEGRHEGPVDLFSYSPEQVAHCLTWSLFSDVYQHVSIRDLLLEADHSLKLKEMITKHEDYAWWVLTNIFKKNLEVVARAQRVVFFINVAFECRRHRNYHTLFGIVAGLSQPLMRWLWDFVKDTDKARFAQLERVVSAKRDYLVYKADLSKCSTKSHIPFLGVTTKVITPLYDNVPARSPESPHLINFSRCVAIQSAVDGFLLGQTVPYVRSAEMPPQLLTRTRMSMDTTRPSPSETLVPSTSMTIGRPIASVSEDAISVFSPGRSESKTLFVEDRLLWYLTKDSLARHHIRKKDDLDKISQHLKKKLAEDLVRQLEKSGFM